MHGDKELHCTVPLDTWVGLCCVKPQDLVELSLSDHWYKGIPLIAVKLRQCAENCGHLAVKYQWSLSDNSTRSCGLTHHNPTHVSRGTVLIIYVYCTSNPLLLICNTTTCTYRDFSMSIMDQIITLFHRCMVKTGCAYCPFRYWWCREMWWHVMTYHMLSESLLSTCMTKLSIHPV